MIRQLPKLSLASYLNKDEVTKGQDIKVYDIITEATQSNSEGNTLRLELSQKDSEVNEGVRELHGKLVFNTTQMPDRQDLKFGFLFSEDPASGKYDGLQLTTQIDSQNLKKNWKYADIAAVAKPDILAMESEQGFIDKDYQNDWVVKKADSSVVCEDVGRCEISVSFARNFDTLDPEHDIALEVGEEKEYVVVGFYEATSMDTNTKTQIGQSTERIVHMGALSTLSQTALALSGALLFSLAAF